MYLNEMYIDELEEVVKKLGAPRYRADQLFSFFHNSKRTDLKNSNLPRPLIDTLLSEYEIAELNIGREFSSKLDETKKFLFALPDQNLVEGVLMKYKHGYSQCVSTQVGCRMGCAFCASTKAGLVRNLSAAEMLLEVYEVENRFGINVSNVILMGSGEPFDNFENVIRFLKLLHSEKGKNMSYRNMTISTCGVASEIYRFADLNLPITLAISLHYVDDTSRSNFMPINRKYNLDELFRACKYYEDTTSNRISFEYTLIAGENDSVEDAVRLRDRLSNLKSHINLIPLNPIYEFDKKRPSNEEVLKFKNMLENYGLNVTIRRELGSDISASCGQLRAKYEGGVR